MECSRVFLNEERKGGEDFVQFSVLIEFFCQFCGFLIDSSPSSISQYFFFFLHHPASYFPFIQYHLAHARETVKNEVSSKIGLDDHVSSCIMY